MNAQGAEGFLQAVSALVSTLGREYGGEVLKEIWLDSQAYDSIAYNALNGQYAQMSYVNGLFYMFLPEGRLRIRRAT